MKTVLKSLIVEVKRAGRYEEMAYFISVALLAFPITLNLLLLAGLMWKPALDNSILDIISIFLPVLVIVFLSISYRRYEMEKIHLSDSQLKRGFYGYLVYLTASISFFIMFL